MLMPHRSYASTANYRFGFNGKENDNEPKGLGNEQDYGMRIYDTRLGKFLSTDPITNEYPWYTPYQFAGNKPISFVDLDGLEEADSKNIFDEIWDFLFSTQKFGNGAMQVAEGAVQKSLAESGQASYNRPEIPQYVQQKLELRDRLAGTAKMVDGTSEMYLASAEASANFVPLERVVSVGAKSLYRGAALLTKLESKVLTKSGERAIFSVKDKQLIFQFINEAACFVSGTLVLTIHGYKRIEDIVIGDSVLSYNETANSTGFEEVTNVTVKKVHTIIKLYFDNNIIEATPEHPFWISGEWKEAKNIRNDDSLVAIGGNKFRILKVQTIDSVSKVYNLSVSNNHTFCVTTLNIITHNNNCGEKLYKWVNYGFKHVAPKGLSWRQVVQSTKNGPAKYVRGLNIEELERKVLNEGTQVEGKNWKVLKHDSIIGAKDGVQTQYSRVEITPDGSFHGSPITETEYNKLTKKSN